MAAASVLLVDGHPALLRILAQFVDAEADMVVAGTARTGEQALLCAVGAEPEVVVLDPHMIGPAGFRVIRRLRDMLPGAAIIALTLLDTPGYREAALAAGADDCVSKAAVNTDLLPAVRRLAQREEPARAIEQVTEDQPTEA